MTQLSQEVHDEMLNVNEQHLYDESISSMNSETMDNSTDVCHSNRVEVEVKGGVEVEGFWAVVAILSTVNALFYIQAGVGYMLWCLIHSVYQTIW